MNNIFILDYVNKKIIETKIVKESRTFIFIDYFKVKKDNKIRKGFGVSEHNIDETIQVRYSQKYYFYSDRDALKMALGMLKEELEPYNNLIDKFLV